MRRTSHPKKNAKAQTWITLITTVVALTLFSIESELYSNIHRSSQEIIGTIDHDSGTSSQQSLELAKEKQKQQPLTSQQDDGRTRIRNAGEMPATRVGMVKRESLRTAKMVTTDMDQLLIKKRADILRQPKAKAAAETSNRIAPSLSTHPVHPLVVLLEDDSRKMQGVSYSIKRQVEPMGTVSEKEDRANDNEIVRDYERPYFEHCEPIQTPDVHPTCNTMHEIRVHGSNTPSLLSTRGSWRSVWKLDLDSPLHSKKRPKTNSSAAVVASNTTFPPNENQSSYDASEAAVVLKMLHIHRRFDQQSFRAHNTDIIVMDRLTASPYVVDAFGFCGQSVLTEFASLTGRDYVKSYELRNKERFRVVRDLAFGLADIQALQPLDHSPVDNAVTTSMPPVFAHNDINIANVVAINGKVKWNDFNIGEFLRWKRRSFESSITVRNASGNCTEFIPFLDNSDNNTICPIPVRYRSDLWRSPEEIRNNSYVRAEQIDMYGFGNILYQTMTRHQPWTHKEPGGKLGQEDVGAKKLEGDIPTVPEQYLNATTRDLQIMFVATLSCYDPDPSRRPSASRLANGLGVLYSRMKNRTRISRMDILDQILPFRATIA